LAHCLTIEENTVLGNWLKKGKIAPADDLYNDEEYQMLTEKLLAMGYVHYEVSNFCLPGMESRHNAAYWKDQKYLGIGPGAHSFDKNSRQFNVSNNALYIKAIKEGHLHNTVEKLTTQEKINDYLLTTLRTQWGVSIKHLKEEWNFDILSDHKDYLAELSTKGLCEINNEFICLTTSGFLFADKISSDLFVEGDSTP